ncbi:MAG: PhzF family phenazine biosynthesis protein, partial [Acidobacteriota bacterium]
MGQKVTQVDAFTDKPFAGNPAAVCVLKEAADEAWMQNVTKEMNLSETAFLYAREGEFSLRWFTPAVEVALCGHATLASAHVLWEEGYLGPNEQARFRTKSGLLTADPKGDWIELDFPAVREDAASPPPGLLESIGVEARYVGKNKFDYLIEVESEDIVRNV